MTTEADLSEYRASEREQQRVADLMSLVAEGGGRAMDVGARDGYLAVRLAERFSEVIALDLELPRVSHPRVVPVRGDARALEYADGWFDTVLCAEVLEHIPGDQLAAVCGELARVCGGALIIGVPYRQDLRVGRTTCQSCGKANPPWGHVNSFEEDSIRALFPSFAVERFSYVGTTRYAGNALATRLLDFAGNPYGTWEQEEPCIHCGSPVGQPAPRRFAQKLATRAATICMRLQHAVRNDQANWLHVRLRKQRAVRRRP